MPGGRGPTNAWGKTSVQKRRDARRKISNVESLRGEQIWVWVKFYLIPYRYHSKTCRQITCPVKRLFGDDCEEKLKISCLIGLGH